MVISDDTPVTLTPIAERLAVELLLPVFLSRLGYEHNRGQGSNSHRRGSYIVNFEDCLI